MHPTRRHAPSLSADYVSKAKLIAANMQLTFSAACGRPLQNPQLFALLFSTLLRDIQARVFLLHWRPDASSATRHV
jgi:hypothetical protein